MDKNKNFNDDMDMFVILLNQLKNNCGAYGIDAFYSDGKVSIQCEHEKLKNFIDERNLKFNSTYHNTPAYEENNFILFSDINFRVGNN